MRCAHDCRCNACKMKHIRVCVHSPKMHGSESRRGFRGLLAYATAARLFTFERSAVSIPTRYVPYLHTAPAIEPV